MTSANINTTFDHNILGVPLSSLRTDFQKIDLWGGYNKKALKSLLEFTA